jgi:hypothetical protein
MYSFLNILSFVFNALESAYLQQINNAENIKECETSPFNLPRIDSIQISFMKKL